MNLPDKIILYRKAYRTWGVGAQTDMVIEECSELIQALSKGKRKGMIEVQASITDELVDVEIMIEQLKVIMSDHFHSFDGMYMRKREEKLERLDNLLRGKEDKP